MPGSERSAAKKADVAGDLDWSAIGASWRELVDDRGALVLHPTPKLVRPPSLEVMVHDRTRALDRVLLWGHYVIPHWHFRFFRVAYWDRFGRPQITPKYALGFDTWWIDSAKEAALKKRRSSQSSS